MHVTRENRTSSRPSFKTLVAVLTDSDFHPTPGGVVNIGIGVSPKSDTGGTGITLGVALGVSVVGGATTGGGATDVTVTGGGFDVTVTGGGFGGTEVTITGGTTTVVGGSTTGATTAGVSRTWE